MSKQKLKNTKSVHVPKPEPIKVKRTAAVDTTGMTRTCGASTCRPLPEVK